MAIAQVHICEVDAMMYLHWAILAPLSLLMAIVGRLLCPILPLFVEEDGYLPDWLWWFQTPDNPCDGDEGHWERHPGTDAWSTYKRRMAWFWRNVAYGFDIEILGAKCKAGDFLEESGDLETDTKPAHSGWVYRELKRDGKAIYWQFYFVYQYPFWKSRCIRGNLGWKLWNYEGETVTVQWTGMINPLFGAE